MTKEFETGTTTKKSADEVFDLLKTAVKRDWHIDAAEIKPVFMTETNEPVAILGFEIIHADPKPRATRSDKGIPRGPKSPDSKQGSATEQKKPSPKSPFTSDKVAS